MNIKYIFYAFVLLVSALIFLHFYTLENENLKNNFEIAQTKAVADEKKKDEIATDKLETKYETITKVEVQYVDRIVTKEVIRYRDAVPVRCVLDPEWVRIHNLSTEQAGASNSASLSFGGTAPTGIIAH